MNRNDTCRREGNSPSIIDRAGRIGRAALLAAAAALAVPGSLWADEASADAGFLAGATLPLSALFGSTMAAEEAEGPHYRTNADLTFGPFFSGYNWMNLGSSSHHNVPADVGAMVDLKAETEILRMPLAPALQTILQIFPFLGLHQPREADLFLGGEIAYAGQGIKDGPVLAKGEMHRFYFMIPVSLDFPILPGDSLLPNSPQPAENPFSIRFALAPGLQFASPSFDDGTVTTNEEDIWAFNLRARIELRMPISQGFGFNLAVVYDWAEKNFSGPDASLSSLSALIGFHFIW